MGFWILAFGIEFWIFKERNLLEELKYFQKKYSFKIEILSDQNLIIPEYKIDL